MLLSHDGLSVFIGDKQFGGIAAKVDAGANDYFKGVFHKDAYESRRSISFDVYGYLGLRTHCVMGSLDGRAGRHRPFASRIAHVVLPSLTRR